MEMNSGGSEQMARSEQMANPTAPEALPTLHCYAWKGDLPGVLDLVSEGFSVHETISIKNQRDQTVHGVTPLFLAAQRGHSKVCKLLVENGANPKQPAYLADTTELCTPADVAQLNMHMMLAHYLRKAVKQRRKEDVVIAQDEADTERRRAPPVLAGLAIMSADLTDLEAWNPEAPDAPATMDGNKVSKAMKKNKLDLYAWEARDDLAGAAAATAAASATGGSGTSRAVAAVDDEDGEYMPSRSRPADAADIGDDDGTAINNGPQLSRFLKDLDLQTWDPLEEGAVAVAHEGGVSVGSRAGSRRSSINGRASPSGRSAHSATSSLGGRVSPARSGSAHAAGSAGGAVAGGRRASPSSSAARSAGGGSSSKQQSHREIERNLQPSSSQAQRVLSPTGSVSSNRATSSISGSGGVSGSGKVSGSKGTGGKGMSGKGAAAAAAAGAGSQLAQEAASQLAAARARAAARSGSTQTAATRVRSTSQTRQRGLSPNTSAPPPAPSTHQRHSPASGGGGAPYAPANANAKASTSQQRTRQPAVTPVAIVKSLTKQRPGARPGEYSSDEEENMKVSSSRRAAPPAF
ncbi:hypothetical protein FOA52_003863 [Chlamydomonas sp. UWO 241]|nr:hypothetical protein FOA52_003863 [Chlamydomonas sp. UWO 241]